MKKTLKTPVLGVFLPLKRVFYKFYKNIKNVFFIKIKAGNFPRFFFLFFVFFFTPEKTRKKNKKKTVSKKSRANIEATGFFAPYIDHFLIPWCVLTPPGGGGF